MSESSQFSPMQLLEHGQFMRRMARVLTADDHLQDDLIQETYLRALEKPPRDQASTKGWMRTVATNLARMNWRSGTRRLEREKVAAKEEMLPATDWTAERRELLQMLTAAVTSLEEPFRTVVLHRFFDDLPPREIARLTGAPVETVRTRLKRALVLLRDALDRKTRGDRKAWMTPMVLLARLPFDAPGSLALASGSGTAGTWITSVAFGALIMKKSFLLVSLALLAIAGYFVLEPLVGEPGGVPADKADPAGMATSKSGPGNLESGLPQRRPMAPDQGTTRAAEVVPAPGDLLVRVVDHQGKFCPGVPTRLRCGRENGRRLSMTHLMAITDTQRGIATYRGLQQVIAAMQLPEGEQRGVVWEVALDLPLARPCQHRFAIKNLPGKVVELVLPATGSVVVEAKDISGKPFKGDLEIGLAKMQVDLETGQDRQGAIECIRRINNGQAIFSHVGLDFEIAVFGIRRQVGEPDNWEDIAVLEKTIVQGDGPGHAGSRVTLCVTLPPTENTTREKPMAAPVLAGGVVVDQDGKPIRQASVQIIDQLFHLRDSNGKNHFRPKIINSMRVGVGGSFTFKGHAVHHEVGLAVYAKGYKQLTKTLVARGATGVRLVMHETGGLAGSVLLSEKATVDRLEVRFSCPSPKFSRRTTVGNNNDFKCSGLVAGRYEVVVGIGRQCLARFADVEVKGGVISADSCLQEIDLRDKFFSHQIFVKDSKGILLDRAVIKWGEKFSRDITACATRTTRVNGKTRYTTKAIASIATLAPRVDIIVTARGYRPRKLISVNGDIEVVMTRAPQVKLVMDKLPTLHHPSHSVRLILSQVPVKQVAYEDGPWTMKNIKFNEQGEVLRFFNSPGIYKLRWQIIRQKDKWHFKRFNLPVLKGEQITIKDIGEVQEIQIKVPLERLSKASQVILKKD